MRVILIFVLAFSLNGQEPTKTDSGQRSIRTQRSGILRNPGSLSKGYAEERNQLLERALNSNDPDIQALESLQDKQLILLRKDKIKERPDSAAAYFDLGEGFLQLGLMEKAVRAYEQSIQIKPRYAIAHYRLAQAYLKMGNRESAIKEQEILAELNEDMANELFIELSK